MPFIDGEFREQLHGKEKRDEDASLSLRGRRSRSGSDEAVALLGGQHEFPAAKERRQEVERIRKLERVAEALRDVLDPGGHRLEGLVLGGWASGTGLDDATKQARAALADMDAV